MLNVLAMPLGDYQTNVYAVHNNESKTCVVIDPGYEPGIILSKLRGLGLTVEAILLTHGHFDHVGAVEELVENTGCGLWMHKADWDKPMTPLTAQLYPLANCDFTEVSFCREGTQITAAGLTFTVLETPGHTEGSVCYRCEGALFSGDTLFAGSCGRTDLPGGDSRAMGESLSRLAALKENLRVFPGHGEASTLDLERRTNPYL